MTGWSPTPAHSPNAAARQPIEACPKCGNTVHREELIRTTGDGLSRLLNLQNQRFRARICTACGFTELYSMSVSRAGAVADAIFGG